MMKMTVLYHSVTGNTKTMAQVIAEGMMTVAGVEAKAFPIENWAARSSRRLHPLPMAA